MSYQQVGRIVKVLEKQSGVSNAGKEWVKQTFVIDIGTEFNNEIAFNLFGEYKVALLEKYSIGTEVTVHFNLNSREWQGRYFTSADAYQIADHVPLNPRDKDGEFLDNAFEKIAENSEDLPF